MTDTSTWIPAPPADTFAARLRLIRLAMGDASIEDMAKRCGLSPATWRTWEHGASPHRLARVVEQIHRATKVDMAWLVWGEMRPGGSPSALTPGGEDDPGDLPEAQSRCIGRSASFEAAA